MVLPAFCSSSLVFPCRIPQLLSGAGCQVLVTAQRSDLLPSATRRVNLSWELVLDSQVASAVVESYWPAGGTREPVSDT